MVKLVLTLKDCDNIPGAIVRSFENEIELLKFWEEFIQLSDPDIISGYNIVNFDLPYILDRGKHLLDLEKKSGFKENSKKTSGNTNN